MKPTMKLRFVEREHTERVGTEIFRVSKYKQLQQWWEIWGDNRNEPVGEWRDVEVADETN